MEQVVLKPQNLPKQLGLLADSTPPQGHPSISDLITEAYETYPLSGRIMDAIQMKNELQEISIAECIQDGGRIRYRRNLDVPDSDKLRLHIIQEHHDTTEAGHPGRAKTFDLLDRGYYWMEMHKDVDMYVRNCHDCQQSRSSRHSIFGVLRPICVPDIPLERYLDVFCHGMTGVRMVWCNMGSGGLPFKDATFLPMPYNYRCPAVGGVVTAGSGTSSWTPINHCFGMRAAVCFNFLATGGQSVGDWS